MFLEYNYLELAPFGTSRIASITIPWASILQLLFVVYGCMIAARSTLVPGQRRVATDAARSSTWETRPLKEIILVSSPVGGTAWPSRFIRKCQEITTEFRHRIVTNSSLLQRLEDSGLLGPFVLSSIIVVSAPLSVVMFSILMFRDSTMKLFGLPLPLASTLVTICIGLLSSSTIDYSRLWFIEDLLFHPALEIDGFVYELAIGKSFNVSIEAKRTPVEEYERETLAKRPHGYTFFTPDEILDSGEFKTINLWRLLAAHIQKLMNLFKFLRVTT